MLKEFMKKKTKALWMLCSVVILFGVFFSSVGCGLQEPEALVSDMNIEEPDVIDITEKNAVITDFSVRLFQQSLEDEKNTLIAPVSVLSALSMVVNGADGNTLAQMEDVIGVSVKDLNEYMYSYSHHLSETSDENNKLFLTNSIWIKDDKDLTIYDSFLQTNDTYYDASIYKTAFDDKCVEDINNWVNENTQGMIPEILDKIPPEAIMYLINTLAFEGKWDTPYTDSDIREGDFKLADETIQRADFMYSEENLYLEDENAVGFIKCYMDEKYAFAALLPNEDVDIEEYINSLNGERLHNLLSNPKNTEIFTSMPKFTSEYDVEMGEVLKGMGMTDAFNYNVADFSRLGYMPDHVILLDEILHKTYIDVNENGTTAAAATVVEFYAPTSGPDYEVILDRPFVYILMDCENNIPLFMGTVMRVE